MSMNKLELNVFSEKIRSNDKSLGSKLNCYALFKENGMTLCFVVDDDWTHVGLSVAVRQTKVLCSLSKHWKWIRHWLKFIYMVLSNCFVCVATTYHS